MSALFRCSTHGKIAIDVAGGLLASACCPVCKRAMERLPIAQRVLIVPADTYARVERVAGVQGVRMGQIADAYLFDIGRVP